MEKKKSGMGIAFGIAFVWFTTQFGGGFASGAQLKQYFLRFGIYCLFTCIGHKFAPVSIICTFGMLRKKTERMITQVLTKCFMANIRRCFQLCMKLYIL